MAEPHRAVAASSRVLSGRVWRIFVGGILIAGHTLLVLSSISAIVSDHELTKRQDARSLVLSEESSDTDVFVRPGREVWQGRTIYFAWLAPAEASGQSALPPGIAELPEPGSAAVSPALDALARTHPSLGRLYPHRTVIGDAGVGRATELIAYLRPAADRRLGGEDQALRMDGAEVTGDAATIRVGRFGEGGLPLFDDEPRSWWAVPSLAVAVGLTPAVVLLLVGLRSSVPRAQRRRPRTTEVRGRSVTAVLPLLASLPGIAVGSVAWLLLSSRTDFVPLTRMPVVQGHPALPLTFAAMLSVTCLIILVDSALSNVRRLRPGNTGPVTPLSSTLRAVPLAVSALLFAASNVLPPSRGLPLLPIASLCALAGTCLIIPVLLSAMGSRLATSPRLSPELAGRSFQLDPVRAARPFYGLTILVVMFIIFLPSSVSSGASSGSVGNLSGFSAVQVEWMDVAPGDFAAFRSNLRFGEAFPVGAAGHHAHGGQHTHGNGGEVLQVGATCDELAPVVAIKCPHRDSRALSAHAEGEVARAIGLSAGESIEGVTLVDPRRLAQSGRAVVLGRLDVGELDLNVRQAARQTLPAAQVHSEVSDGDPAHLDQQIIGGLVYRLLILLGFAALLVIVDGVLAGRDFRRVALGSHEASRSMHRRFLVVKFLTGWWAIGGLAVAIGWIVRIQTPGAGQREAAILGAASIVLGLMVGSVLGVMAIWALADSEFEPVTDAPRGLA